MIKIYSKEVVIKLKQSGNTGNINVFIKHLKTKLVNAQC